MELAKITQRLLGQKMFEFLVKAKDLEKNGKKIIHFELGDPNFNSPPFALEAVKKALDQGLTHYVDSMGLLEFREAIAEYTSLYWGFNPSVKQILVCPANAIIDFAIRCIVNPGEEVIYPDPGFPTYHSVINYNGMVPVGIKLTEENSFRMNPKDVRDKITEKTRLIIINSPGNPTGSVMKEEEVLEIARIAKEHNLYLLSDEVYAKIIYEGSHCSPSALDYCRERTILLSGLSKMYAMSGWRLGYAIGPEELIKKMKILLQTIISCLPGFLQWGGIETLLKGESFVVDMVETLKKRRDLLVEGLNSLPGISCTKPQGAFYVLPNIKNTGMDECGFADKLLMEGGICVSPGSVFGEFGKGYLRLAYASTGLKEIEKSLHSIKHLLGA